MPIPQLNIDRLHPPHLLDEAELDSLSGAARACLSKHHVPPVSFVIEADDEPFPVELAWSTPTDAQRLTAANHRESTARGACGCALAAATHARGLVAYAAAPDGSGADYRMLPAEEAPRDLENCVLLEVSGVATGGRGTVASRRNARLRRLRRIHRDDPVPALVAVIGFDSRIIELRTAE